jgi:hypothetical protein
MSVNWLGQIAQGNSNRALLPYALGLSCLYSGKYGESSTYFSQSYSIIQAGQDNLLTDTAIWRYFSARDAARSCEANDDFDTALNWCNEALEALRSPDIIDGEITQDESHVRELQGEIGSIIQSVREKMK